jgi:pyruvate kinase
MIRAGMDVARFNFSHGTHEEHGARMENLRWAAKRAGKRIGIMLDTKGPEIRLGRFRNGKAHLEEGSRFALTSEEILGNTEQASVSFPRLAEVVSPGALILLDDGNVQLEVLEAGDGLIITRVLNSGWISDRKKVAVPGSGIEGLPAVSEQDKADIRFGVQNGIDFVAASFVRSADDVLAVRRALEELNSKAQIIAKVESVYGVNALEEILKTADGLMVARGDLGVEYPPEEIPVLQKKMISLANRLGKPVITATQMLESMIENPRATRAEASDVANAILDGADAVMLSGETASGKYPVEAVKFMAKVALQAEGFLDHEVFMSRSKGTTANVTEAVSRSAVESAVALGASAIITPTESGYTARMVARFRPKIPVFAVTPHEETCGWLTLVWGVEAVMGPRMAGAFTGPGDGWSAGDARHTGAAEDTRDTGELKDTKGDGAPGEPDPSKGRGISGSAGDHGRPGEGLSEDSLPGDVSDMAIHVLREKGLIEDGALCVVTKGVPQGISGTTNVMEVRTVGDVVLQGSGIGQMAVSGKVVVAATGEEAVSKAFPGCVLVAPATDKSFVPALRKAAALIMEQGGLTSDGAIAALHLNIPAVVGATNAARLLRDGDIVTVDGARGVVYRGVARVR